MLSDQSYIKNSEDFLKIQSTAESRYVMCCAIFYHLYNSKNNTSSKAADFGVFSSSVGVFHIF